MEQHKTISLADQVFERLESEILGGRYQPGELLTELRLTEDLGVSRTPVREALRRLEQERLIELSTRGIVVLGVTERDIEDIFTVRVRVEGLAAARAAEARGGDYLPEMREAIELQEYYVGRHDADHIKYMDNRFHELVYDASGSTVLRDVLLPLHKKTQKYRKASVQNESRAERSLAEHRAVYEAIAAGDAAAAEVAMTTHVQNAMAHMLKKQKEC
ncbi:MAG: GntR family transcriptional regulator [Oscillospiraceae bacterium]|jgi:DNA-binding GntR family transcriptional regulator|nr:GntR family transcriptional regulator [Oscillospiraceae bacterium]